MVLYLHLSLHTLLMNANPFTLGELNYSPILFFFFFFFFFFFWFSLLYQLVLCVGVFFMLFVLFLPAYTSATEIPDPSCIYDLHHSSWQLWILNPLIEARDPTHNLMFPSWIRFHCATAGPSIPQFLYLIPSPLKPPQISETEFIVHPWQFHSPA